MDSTLELLIEAHSKLELVKVNTSLYECWFFHDPVRHGNLADISDTTEILQADLHHEVLPAWVEKSTKTYHWNYHGYRHRENGPALTNDSGHEYYYWYDKMHRYDGPAYNNAFFNNKRYYLHGKWIDGQEYPEWLDMMGMDINNLTDSDKVLIDLKWK